MYFSHLLSWIMFVCGEQGNEINIPLHEQSVLGTIQHQCVHDHSWVVFRDLRLRVLNKQEIRYPWLHHSCINRLLVLSAQLPILVESLNFRA